VELVDGHSEQLGDAAQRIVRHPAAAPLHDLQRVDACGALAVVVHELALDLRDFFGRQAHRSTSAITKSMLPRIAIRSAIIRPREISGSTCRCGNDGVRIRSRYGSVPPSLIA